jgi:hypothetical protein
MIRKRGENEDEEKSEIEIDTALSPVIIGSNKMTGNCHRLNSPYRSLIFSATNLTLLSTQPSLDDMESGVLSGLAECLKCD